ncbi:MULTISPECIES: hypothetical protein [Aphanothece]|uniref:hypothetical protein n=1 Tax=Aphanothece TaxID=1121 RepID=UPI003985064B
MAGIQDRAYTIACSRLASVLGVSLASARRKVDVQAAAAGIRDGADKLALAEEMLAAASSGSASTHELLSSLLEAVGNDEHFMLED